ncbi:regulator [Streptomyces paludis]|uniref:Regulator n=1 Tax=Streptomyces paludis TaxID=2282738 RepID=A0A345HVQ8_9ACTN|nr:regulator [Streptomyces paludis]AXG80782.1 regulator [Streptomyces paludis]
MTTRFTTAEVRNATELLASRSLIRLITEIDDNGAIPPQRLTATFTDLSSHQLRRATETARTHGLVRNTPGTGLELTHAGSELADLYDATARWSRRHAYPAPVCEFSNRVRHVLGLLTPSLAAESTDIPARLSTTRLSSVEAEADLAHPRALLLHWLAGNPQLVSEPVPGT